MAQEMEPLLAFQPSKLAKSRGRIVNRLFVFRWLAFALLRPTAAVFLLCANVQAEGADEVAKHKARMDDAQDLKYDLADAISTKSTDKLAESARAIVKLLELEDIYWKNSGLADAIALSKQNLDAAKRIAKAGKITISILPYKPMATSNAAAWPATTHIRKNASGSRRRPNANGRRKK